MSDKKSDSEPKRSLWDRLGNTTGRISKVSALVLAVVALLTAFERFFEIGPKFIERFKTEESLKDCFKAEMNYPRTVSISEWQSMPLSLTGRNRCREKLGVHLAFKTKSLAMVAFESPVSDCRDLVNSNCWEEKSIDTGEVNEKFIPPHLKLLKKPLGEPVDVNINWVVYNVETRQQLDSGVAQIHLKDDP